MATVVHMDMRDWHAITVPGTGTKNVIGYASSFWISRRKGVFSGTFHGLHGPWNCRKKGGGVILLTTSVKSSNKVSYPDPHWNFKQGNKVTFKARVFIILLYSVGSISI